MNQADQQRKAMLLQQGAYYRAGIAACKLEIRDSLRPEVVFHRAIGHLGLSLREKFSAADGSLQLGSLAPYALTAVGFLRKRGWLKPAFGLVAFAGAAAWYLRRQHTH